MNIKVVHYEHWLQNTKHFQHQCT